MCYWTIKLESVYMYTRYGRKAQIVGSVTIYKWCNTFQISCKLSQIICTAYNSHVIISYYSRGLYMSITSKLHAMIWAIRFQNLYWWLNLNLKFFGMVAFATNRAICFPILYCWLNSVHRLFKTVATAPCLLGIKYQFLGSFYHALLSYLSITLHQDQTKWITFWSCNQINHRIGYPWISSFTLAIAIPNHW